MISRPNKTLADYIAIAISPALIMALVGSLCFFLVEVFYRGEAAGSVRWVLFWFVLATVLVARLGIEQGTTYAAIYGIALAVATWLYLTRVQPAPLLGAILLGIVWWCAHKLTWDCTLIDDEQDASGKGLLQTAFKKEHHETVSKEPPKLRTPGLFSGDKKALHPPGRWLIYFSLAALPLFGIGQVLLPAGDLDARRIGFHYLFAYLCAAIGLLLTTSFLGLRRYLRQRYLPMPANVALGWLKFGAGMAAMVLLLALLVPRPGGSDAWATLRYHVDYQLRRASQYAMRFNPHGTGKPENRNPPDTSPSPNPKSQSGQQPSNSGPKTPDHTGDQNGQNHSPSKKGPPPLSTPAAHLYQLLKWLLWLGGAALVAWWIFRRREMLLQMWREFWAALAQFFRNLFGFRLTLPGTGRQRHLSKPRLFVEYQNPFLSGQETNLTPQQLILYSYEALQCWAVEQEITGSPEQTAREFCRQLSGSFLEIAPELNHLAFVHGHASYGTSIPNSYRPELLKQLWDYMSTPRLQPAQVA
jgi:hypothetical protein